MAPARDYADPAALAAYISPITWHYGRDEEGRETETGPEKQASGQTRRVTAELLLDYATVMQGQADRKFRCSATRLVTAML